MMMVRGRLFHVEYPFTQFPQMTFTVHRQMTKNRLPEASLSQRSVSLQDLLFAIPSWHMGLFLP